VIATDDDHTSTADAQIVQTLMRPGDHRVIVTSYQPGVGGTYRLRVTAGPASP